MIRIRMLLESFGEVVWFGTDTGYDKNLVWESSDIMGTQVQVLQDFTEP